MGWQLVIPVLERIFNRVVPDPTEKAKIEKELVELGIRVQEAEMEREARLIEAVNATMREEAKSEHWAQWLWRPTIGFTFAAVIINNYIILPYLQNVLKPIVIPDNIWTAMLVILGAAVGFRGWQKVEETKRNGNGNGAVKVRVAKPSTKPAAPFTSETGFARERNKER